MFVGGILFSCCPSICSWFPLDKLSSNDSILLKFIWYLTINKIQVEFDKEDYAPILSRVIAPDRSEKGKIYGFPSIT